MWTVYSATQETSTDEVAETMIDRLLVKLGKELIVKSLIAQHLTIIRVGLLHLGGLRFLFVGRRFVLRVSADISMARTRVGTYMATGLVAEDFAMKTGKNRRWNSFHIWKTSAPKGL